MKKMHLSIESFDPQYAYRCTKTKGKTGSRFTVSLVKRVVKPPDLFYHVLGCQRTNLNIGKPYDTFYWRIICNSVSVQRLQQCRDSVYVEKSSVLIWRINKYILLLFKTSFTSGQREGREYRYRRKKREAKNVSTPNCCIWISST